MIKGSISMHCPNRMNISFFVIQIGPLPVSADTQIQQMTADGQIPFTKRPINDLPELLALYVRPYLC